MFGRCCVGAGDLLCRFSLGILKFVLIFVFTRGGFVLNIEPAVCMHTCSSCVFSCGRCVLF